MLIQHIIVLIQPIGKIFNPSLPIPGNQQLVRAMNRRIITADLIFFKFFSQADERLFGRNRVHFGERRSLYCTKDNNNIHI